MTWCIRVPYGGVDTDRQLVFTKGMTTAADLRSSMVALTASMATTPLTAAWADAARQRATASGDERTALDLALATMTDELVSRGVSREVLDGVLWSIEMAATA